MASKSHGLRTYVLRRLLLMVPTLVGVTFVVFLLTQFVPGGPIEQLRMRLAGGGGNGEVMGGGSSGGPRTEIPEEQLKVLKEYYGFDKPVIVRYGMYMKNLATLDLGESQRYLKPVTELIVSRMPVSLYFGLITLLLTYSVCIPLGILKALKHRTAVDNLTSALIFIGYSVPSYALGAVLLVTFAVKLDMFPLSGFHSTNWDQLGGIERIKDQFNHTLLPLICLTIGSFAFMTMLMKNSLMENMSADYVKTALAKGMTWKRAVFVHALRNSLIPMATSVGNNISVLIAGFL
ncbi:MAG: ABC transporter permease subunit, partial [Candidatus Eisenbacteria bacterium]|nr:ABC transporter permease subunit [Candidatus Eisenbacteria bacterium]